PVLEAVPRRRDDDDAGPEGSHDGLFLERRALLAAEADVGDAGSPLRRRVEACDLLAERGALAEARAGVPALQDGLRVDPDEALAVHGRADHRADRGPVALVLAPDRAL